MRRILLGISCLFAAMIATGQLNPALQVQELELSNGMKVWLNVDHSQPKVFGAVVVNAGAVDCPDTGIAHYFEHIMFKGTDELGTVDYAAERVYLDSISMKYDELARTTDAKQRKAIQHDINQLNVKASQYAIPNEFNRLITKYGGSDLNAGTSYDFTYYHNTFSPQFIEQWCVLNSHRLVHPVFRLFQGELETVYEEKNMYADDPASMMLEQISSKFLAGTPYAYPIIGSTENLKNPRQSDMVSFYKKYYVASNMGLVLSGDMVWDKVYYHFHSSPMRTLYQIFELLHAPFDIYCQIRINIVIIGNGIWRSSLALNHFCILAWDSVMGIIGHSGMPDYSSIPNMRKTHGLDTTKRLLVKIVHLSTTILRTCTILLTCRVLVAKQTGKNLINDDFLLLHSIILKIKSTNYTGKPF